LKAEEVKVNSNGEVVADEGISVFDKGNSGADGGISFVVVVVGSDTM
jgi:hypothetical protein